MIVALGAEVFADHRGGSDDRLAAGHLAVEQTEGVALQPALAVLTDLMQMFPVVGLEPLDVEGAALRTAGAVELKGEIREAQFGVELPGDRHDLQIDGRILLAEGFDIELGVLAEPAGLRSFKAEDRTDRIELDRLGEHMQPVLQVEAHDPGSELGAQGQWGFALVEKAVHLFLHDVGGLTHPANEKRGFFKNRGIDPLVAEKSGNLGNFFLNEAPVGLLFRKDVAGAAHRFISDFHKRLKVDMIKICTPSGGRRRDILLNIGYNRNKAKCFLDRYAAARSAGAERSRHSKGLLKRE
ncbi:MAG: hypothetical protein BWY77_00856 [bacterium ADurb.Bin431]|nr:MAG: hypothetical protein BWY77_00856 [bacterium ADurb.Bin431]